MFRLSCIWRPWRYIHWRINRFSSLSSCTIAHALLQQSSKFGDVNPRLRRLVVNQVSSACHQLAISATVDCQVCQMQTSRYKRFGVQCIQGLLTNRGHGEITEMLIIIYRPLPEANVTHTHASGVR
jgi:hypothetical protein